LENKQRELKKNIFICKSTRKVSPSVLGNVVRADSILYKAMGNGFLFLIRFEKKDKKRGGQRHSFMERKIQKMDKQLQGPMVNASTWFESIGEEEHETKVRSFSLQGRLDDHLFREIYDVELTKVNGDYPLKAGVQKWSASLPDTTTSEWEFDVVKKRRMMDSTTGDDDEPAALAAFEEFERSVLPAMERIQEAEDLLRRLETLELDEDKRRGKTETTGGVYFAWSSCLKCMKIGATRRDSPDKRLREISRYVTEKFILVAWVPTPSCRTSPFDLETAAHLHFKDQRINSRGDGSGAGTEFFQITSEEAVEWKEKQA
jgi:hypothetical protein